MRKALFLTLALTMNTARVSGQLKGGDHELLRAAVHKQKERPYWFKPGVGLADIPFAYEVLLTKAKLDADGNVKSSFSTRQDIVFVQGVGFNKVLDPRPPAGQAEGWRKYYAEQDKKLAGLLSRSESEKRK